MIRTITPFLWFNGRVEEATRFYTSLFKNSSIERLSEMSSAFQLEGQRFILFNGGPHFTFTEAVSFFVDCETQADVDELWEKLSAGGDPGRCGWLKDKFGLSWQIIPTVLGEMLQDEDDEKSERVMQAMLQMSKIDIAGLKRAYDRQP
jgi:predicted 3-demethylubiquinone-9 3-methyltransferase (glyoxalase superfamily)